ncbi:MAG: hypothetical protein ABIQ97_00730 [Lysobacteraceae bacterium]
MKTRGQPLRLHPFATCVFACLLLAGCMPVGDSNALACDDPDAFHSADMGAAPPAEVLAAYALPQQTITTCNVEFVNNRRLLGHVDGLARIGLIEFKGWFVDSRQWHSLRPQLYLQFRDAAGKRMWEVPIVNRTPRQDIVAAFNANPDLLLSGFDVTFYAGGLPAGYYSPQLVLRSKRAEAICGGGPVFELR